jgi:hypothetical protein
MEGNDMIYPFKKDPFPGKYAYYFTNRFNDQYEVSFSRDEVNYFKVSVTFCVTNDEYENDQYVVTNHGDVYRVLNTICLIILDFYNRYPTIEEFVFSGEMRPFERENKVEVSGRTRVFLRFVKRYFRPPFWKVVQNGNFVSIYRMQKNND